jgi:hypothetical protein
MASSQEGSAIWGPKNLRFPGPNPLLLAKVINLNRWFYVQEHRDTTVQKDKNIQTYPYADSPRDRHKKEVS